VVNLVVAAPMIDAMFPRVLVIRNPAEHRQLIRLCANTGAAAASVQPLAFAPGSARMRRAGSLNHELGGPRVAVHATSLPCWQSERRITRLFALTGTVRRILRRVEFPPGRLLFVFGSETTGLPPRARAVSRRRATQDCRCGPGNRSEQK